jgi:hypothetical protein
MASPALSRALAPIAARTEPDDGVADNPEGEQEPHNDAEHGERRIATDRCGEFFNHRGPFHLAQTHSA